VSSTIRFPAEPPMTVDAALRLPALRRGAPEVLSGAEHLQRTVRWAHSCEARHIPGLLEGDELLLMTGMGLGTGAAGQRAFVRDLVAQRVAAVVIELGHVFRELPAPLVQEARRQRLPLIALHQEVRFVEVTRQLHTAILTRQLTVERRVTELHQALTTMVLDGAGLATILGALARAIGNPVLLERGGEVVYHAANDAHAEDVLAHWELVRGQLEAGEPAAPTAPVSAPGSRAWGRLVAVPHERPTDALAWSAVERTAPLIALSLARAGEEHLLESRERGNFLHDVMSGRIAAEDMPVRATQLGLAGRHARLLALVAARRTPPAGIGADDRRRPRRCARRARPCEARTSPRCWGRGRAATT
jgi:purine catabolism regulator